MDVKTAFLHGELHEEIFMLPPEVHEEGKDVRKLKKLSYDLKQASRSWYENIDTFFIANGFMRGDVDHSVYFKPESNFILMIYYF